MEKTLRIHHLQYVPFEGLGSMELYLRQQEHKLTSTHLYLGQELPPIDMLDWLIVMGGPMGVHDESEYPWLGEEKSYIRKAIDSGKVVLGICLGAQLMADAMGAKVMKNRHREIGWLPIERTAEATSTVLGKAFPESIEVFHWHGDIFDIPNGGTLLASSEASRNQGFIVDNRIVGLQFHLETTMNSARSLIENCRDELDGSRYVQTESEMLSEEYRFSQINAVMHSLLQKLEAHNA